MPMVSSTAPPSANPSPQKNEINPIGICLSTNNSSIEMPTSVVAPATVAANNIANARNMVNAPNANTFYPSSTVGTTPSGPFQITGITPVMVAKLTTQGITPIQNNSTNRQQTVILQPRNNTNATRATLPMNPIRGSTIISPLSTSPLTSAPAISVRTRVLSGPGHATNTVVNLPVTTTVTTGNSPSNSVKQVIKDPKFIASANNVETLIMTPNDVRSIRTNSANNEIKTNMVKVHNMKVNGPNKPNVIPSSSIVGQPKMISINSTGQSPITMGSRIGYITGTAVSNKPGIIMAPNNSIQKFIFTSPNTTLAGSGPTNVANVVNLGPANLISTGQSTKVSVTPNHQIIATMARPSIVSTSALSANNLQPSPKPTIYTVATTSATVPSSISSLPTTTITFSPNLSATTVTVSSTTVSTSPLVNVKPAFYATSLSPSKPPILTPNSPRPRILSRKRLHSDSPTTTIKVANGSALQCTAAGTIIDLKPPLQGSPILGNCVESPLVKQCVNHVTVKTEDVVSTNAVAPVSADTNLIARKKPRKQLLEPSSPKKGLDEEEHALEELKKEPEKEPVVCLKRPRPPLHHYRDAPKPLPHFIRYTDVRQKPDKKVSITDLLSDAQKPNVGWKVNHMAQQLTAACEVETGALQNRLEHFLKVLENDISPFSSCASTSTLFGAENEKLDVVDKICVKINDLTRANIQRNKVILDHYNESRKLLVNLTTEHKDKVTSLAKKIGHKRGYIK